MHYRYFSKVVLCVSALALGAAHAASQCPEGGTYSPSRDECLYPADSHSPVGPKAAVHTTIRFASQPGGEPAGAWGAIAANVNKISDSATALGFPSEQQAIESALQACSAQSACASVVSFENLCAAVASDDKKHVFTGLGKTKEQASANALQECKQGAGSASAPSSCAIWITPRCPY